MSKLLKPPTTVTINLLEIVKYVKDIFKKKKKETNKTTNEKKD
jgi:hypothetical protein